MKSKGLNVFLTALLIIGVMVVTYMYIDKVDKPAAGAIQYSIAGLIDKSASCGIWNNEFPCVNITFTKGVTFPICNYTAKQDYPVSARFLAGTYWELGYVVHVTQQLAKWNNSIFIDIGANVGTFTLGVAHSLKRRVISVEPNRETMIRLRRSICLGKLGDRVTLLHGAVSDSTNKEVRLERNQDNRGVTTVLEGTACNLTRNLVDCMNETTKTITLDDMLKITDAKTAIIKVDAEGSEVKIFNEETASKFFDQIDVPVVFMEVVYFTLFFRDGGPKENKVNKMVEFFYRRNYAAKTFDMSRPLARDWRGWPYEVAFVKQRN